MKDRFVFIAAALESIELIQSYTESYELIRIVTYAWTSAA